MTSMPESSLATGSLATGSLAPGSLAQRLAVDALGYETVHGEWGRPAIDFDLSPELSNLDAERVGDDAADLVAAQIEDAFLWAAARFNFGLRTLEGDEVSAIKQISVARSLRHDEYVTASSPHRPCVVFAAAPWPLSSRYRMSSLLVHEAMHQGLYLRERRNSPVRPQSLAYSPWKEQLRPGRLVWHSFWTFSVQYAFLGGAVVEGADVLLAEDPTLIDFLADMHVRIRCCAQSLEDFDIIIEEEQRNISQTLAHIARLGERLADMESGYIESSYNERSLHFSSVVGGEVERWSARQLAAQ